MEQSNHHEFKPTGTSCSILTLLAQVAQAGQEHPGGSVQCVASPRALSYCELLLFLLCLEVRPHHIYRVNLFKCSLQAFAEAINLKENLKKIGVYPQPKKTKEQVEAERQVKH